MSSKSDAPVNVTPRGRSSWEDSDDYPNVVFSVGFDLRAIVCAQNIQWIVQRRRISKDPRASARWADKGDCVTKEGLLRMANTVDTPGRAALVDWILTQPALFCESLHAGAGG